MGTSEPAGASLGPRYAPDDPSLPKPWKGLIDGSTGLMYYWNPDTSITQYEKPTILTPPLPSGPPPAASTPKLAPIPVARTVQPNGAIAQQGQHMAQAPQQQEQGQQHHVQLMAQQQGSLSGQAMQQPGQLMPQQLRQQPGSQQMSLQPGLHMPQHPSQQLSQKLGQPQPQQPAQQISQHPGQQTQQYHGPQSQVHQFSQQQHQYMQYQQLPQGQQISQQHTHQSAQGQSCPNQQEYKAPFQKREEVDFQQGNHIGFSPSRFQQNGAPLGHNLPAVTNSVQMQQMGVHSGHPQQFGNSSANVQPPIPMGQLQQTGADVLHQQHGPRFQNQMGPGMMHGQQSNVHPAGLNMGYDDTSHGRAGNDFYLNANKEVPIMGSHQPKLAVIPSVRDHQEMSMDSVPHQNVPPAHGGVLNPAGGHSMHNMYNHATGGPTFTDKAPMRHPFIGSTDVLNLSPAEVYRQQHEVTVTGDNVPAPIMTFEATGFPPELLRAVRYLLRWRSICRTLHCYWYFYTCNNFYELWWLQNGQLEPFLGICWKGGWPFIRITDMHSAGFKSPTPIQAQTWPIALQSRDIVAIAKTGSGKTLGYLIPAFILLTHRRNNSQYGPTVLVLAPTRELATQIQDEVMKFGRSSRVSCTCLYGGAPKGPQLKELERGADIVVATPGRLNDILDMKKIDLGQISLLVLDEADRMLDMGFEPQIRKIVNEIPPRRQTLMYTATWPKEVIKIASDLLVNPVQVNIGSVDVLAANKSITQYVEVVPQMEKQRRLEQILRSQERGSRAIIFCSTKKLCDYIGRSIGRNFGAAVIHGDKSQVERDMVLNQFRSGKFPVLVATDVAARGLDVKDIRVVINYDFPNGVEDYIHRIGRTGRAGATGVAFTFLTEQDWKHAADLIKVLEEANQPVPPEVREMALRGGPGFSKERGMLSRFDSGSGGGRWDSAGRGGMRDGSFGGRGGMRDGGFGGRGGMREGGFGGRGGMRDGGFGGRGGMRDGDMHGRGRSDFFSARGNRGRGLGGPGGGQVGWGRDDRGPHDRYNNADGRGRGRGRGRFDSRRDFGDRSRDRSYSRSPERVRTWGYSRSRSRSRSRSWSRSCSRSRSWSRGRSHSRSRSRSPIHRRSLSRSPSRNRERRRKSRFDEKEPTQPEFEAPAESKMPPMSPGKHGTTSPEAALVEHPPMPNSAEPMNPELGVDQ